MQIKTKRMKSSADIESLVLKCMTKSPNHEPLTARTVASCLDSPYSIYCEKFVDKEEKDEISEYDKLLFQKGNDHETNVIREQYPDAVSVSFESPEIGFRSTIESMV